MKSRMIRNKELKALYGGIGGWLIAAVLILAVGIGAMAMNFNGNDSRIAMTLDTILPVYGLLIPLMTMNIISKEVQKGTIQYVEAIPGAGKAVLLGKFQALLIAFTLPFAVICLLPLVFSLYADVQIINSYISIFVFWLLGIALMALGTLISSYSENNKVAAAVTFCIIAIDYLLPSAAQMLPEGLLPVIAKNLSLFHHYRYYAVNYINVTAIVIYVAVAVLCLLLAVRHMNNRRKVQSPKYIGWAFTAAALILCIVVNMLPSSLTMIDRSPRKLITLSDTTKEFLKNLDTDVEIRYVARQGEENRTVEQILERVEEASDHVTVKQVPGSAAEYDAGTLIVRANHQSVVLNSLELYKYDYSQYTTTLKVDSYYTLERSLITTVQSMVAEETPTFYWVTNHMEMELERSMESYLYQAGMRLQDLNLEEGVPEDAAGVIISSPAFDFSENETAILKSYLSQGGYLLLLTDMSALEMPNLDALMKDYGLVKQNGLIVEGDSNHMANPEYPYYIVPSYMDNDLLLDVENLNSPMALMMAHGIGYLGAPKDTIHVTPLLITSEMAYMKMGEDVSSLIPSEDDPMGPFMTAVTVEDTETGAQILWFASSSVLVEACNEAVNNTDIHVACTSMMNTGEYPVIDLEDKLMFAYTMNMQEGASGKWVILFMGLPILFLVIGMMNLARKK